MLQQAQKKYLSWFIFIALAITWGSSFILMKKSMFASDGALLLSPMEVALFRLVLAMFTLLPVFIFFIRKIPKNLWKYLVVVGIFGNGLPAFLFTYGQTQVSSSLAGILNSTVPLFTLLLGGLFFGLKTMKHNRIGVLIGFIGTTIIILGGRMVLQYDSLFYPFLITVATLCYAISLNTIKRYLVDINALQITAAALTIVGIPSLVYLVFSDIPAKIMAEPALQLALGYTAILAVFGTAIALVFFNWLVKMSSALFASSVTYFIPIVAVMWGWLDHESVSAIQIFGGVVILYGVYLVYKK
jgi:drug/metabolite transporter (DMT)-like permease